MPSELTSENFKTEVLESSIPIVIKAYATWCGPCIQMTPVFQEVAKQFIGKVKFLELNVDQARDLAINFGITSIPTIIFIKSGNIVDKQMGYMDTQTLLQAVNLFIK
jgi:thioredoxin 1